MSFLVLSPCRVCRCSQGWLPLRKEASQALPMEPTSFVPALISCMVDLQGLLLWLQDRVSFSPFMGRGLRGMSLLEI